VGIAKKIAEVLVPIRYRERFKRLIVRWVVRGKPDQYPGIGQSMLDRIDTFSITLDHRIAALEARVAKLEEELKQRPPAPASNSKSG
jgi:uncharacterized small protein (DUF1192 family)